MNDADPPLFVRSLAPAMQPVHVLPEGGEQEEKIYFPQELTGGVCRWVKGQEEEIVWSAAAAACGTERVHVVWSVLNDKIFYLAIKSEDMASHHNSWCPFAALLPGMKDAATTPVCYTYYSSSSAATMLVTSDSLEIYRGISLIARAKAERSSRELNNAPIIELTPDRVARLTPHPWHSLSLFEDRVRRILAMTLVMGSLIFTGLAFLVWLYASMSYVGAHVKLTHLQDHPHPDIAEITKSYADLRIDPMHQQLTDFVKVNDELLALDGLLVTYRINNGQLYWRAIVASSTPSESMINLDATTIEPGTKDKNIIGHGTDAGGNAPEIKEAK